MKSNPWERATVVKYSTFEGKKNRYYRCMKSMWSHRLISNLQSWSVYEVCCHFLLSRPPEPGKRSLILFIFLSACSGHNLHNLCVLAAGVFKLVKVRNKIIQKCGTKRVKLSLSSLTCWTGHHHLSAICSWSVLVQCSFQEGVKLLVWHFQHTHTVISPSRWQKHRVSSNCAWF